MRRWRTLILVALAATGIAGGFVAWKLWPRERAYVTDARNIRTPIDEAKVRDILWDAPVPADDVLQLTGGSMDFSIDADGRRLVFVRGSGASADVFHREWIGDDWSDAVAISSINTTHAEVDVALSGDGTTLLFASDRPGSIGGYDLYVNRYREGEWLPPEALTAANSAADDVGPAFFGDDQVFFSSNRARAAADSQLAVNGDDFVASESAAPFDLYRVGLRGITESVAVEIANSPSNEIAPAVSPAGDFLYFASDRRGGVGGYDLYRSRIMPKSFGEPEPLDSAINTDADERDPQLGLGGFSVFYRSSKRGGEASLLRANSREVFRDIEIERGSIDWAALWRQIAPNLLWAALALLLALLFLAMVRDFQNRKVSLFARCLVASLLAHLMLMLLFNILKVSTTIASALGGNERIRVALTPSASAGEFGEQIRGEFVAVETFEFELPAESPPALEAESVEMPKAVEMMPNDASEAVEQLVTAGAITIDAAESTPADARVAPSDAPVPVPPMGSPAFASPSEISIPETEAVASVDESAFPSAAELVSAIDSNPESIAPRLATSQPAAADSFEFGVETNGGGMPADSAVAINIEAADAQPESDFANTGLVGVSYDSNEGDFAPLVLDVSIPSNGSRGAVSEAAIGVVVASGLMDAGSDVRAAVSLSMEGEFEIMDIGVPAAGVVSDSDDRVAKLDIEAVDSTATAIPIASDPSEFGLPTMDLPSIDLAMPGSPNESEAVASQATSEPSVPVVLAALASDLTRGALPAEALEQNQAGQFVLALFNPKTDASWTVADVQPAQVASNPNESEIEGGIIEPQSATTPSIEFTEFAFGIPTAPKRKPKREPRFASGSIGRIVGTVVDADTGRGIRRARVLLNLPDGDSISVRSDAYGAYELDVSNVPDHFALSASRIGYLPESLNIPRSRVARRELTVNFALSPQSELVIALEEEPVVHHLGNDRFEGRINSQFQRESEGRTFRDEFEVTRDQLPPNYSRAEIRFLVKGVQCPHQVRINGRLVKQRLARAPSDGSFGEYRAAFDPGWLLEGENQFKIRARSCGGDLDDFEFVNVQIRLMP